MGLCMELVPEHISFRLRSVSCNGLHDKTIVRFKLQNVTMSTKPAKNLGDHTHESFDFMTTVHNMTFDILKIDVYDFKKSFGQNVRIGRAYLPLRDLQKKVGNKYDNDGDDNTEPEQSVLSSRFDAVNLCKKHNDAFEIDLPLYKHGSYSKFGSSVHHHSQSDEDQETTVTIDSERSRYVSLVTRRHRTPIARAESFAQQAMNGEEVGLITVQATLCFKDQSRNPLFAHLGKGPLGHNSVGESLSHTVSRARFLSNQSNGSVASESSSWSDQGPIASPPNGAHPTRILMPTSPPNLTRHFGGNNGSPLSPPLSPTYPQSPGSPTSPTNIEWLSRGTPQGTMSSWDGSESNHDESGEFDDDIHGNKDQIKGENITQADRDREEEMMAEIMANGNQAKKDEYLSKSTDDKKQGLHPKGKKAKFSFFSEQTRSAFKDIQLMYSSFFGHGWNLTRSEFWRGFHIVEQFYARHPTPTTNKAFDNIEILEHARHFIRLAIASYGSLPWVYFGYSFKVAPLNFIRFNSDRKNVMDYFKLKKEDMIVWHFDKRTALVPSYYIVRDPKYNALCIIIRGTFSITDAMTDLVCEYYPYKGGLVHKGIMDNARFVLERSGKDIEAALKKFNLNTIYCIGHSLGAGSASLLCALLQDHFTDYVVPATPQATQQKLQVKAYLFAPPPIATPNLAAEWESTQIAFINENDIVCRLSYGNALDLKELIKIGAIESSNPIYDGMDPKEKLDRILQVLEKAQKSLTAVHDIPRLVTTGTVTYLHKVYESTPVVQNKPKDRGSRFGEMDYSQYAILTNTPAKERRASVSSGNSTNSLARSLTAFTSALSVKGHSHSHHRHEAPPTTTDSSNTMSKPIVTPYQPNQPAVHLSVHSFTNVDFASAEKTSPATLVDSPLEAPSRRKSFEPVHYEACQEARENATKSILEESHQGRPLSALGNAETDMMCEEEEQKMYSNAYGQDDAQDDNNGFDVEEEFEEEEEDPRVFTTQKPRKNGSKKKEIRIEFSDKAHFMSIPLRANWLWHHFPQQYDSRVERALAWAKTHKQEQEREQERKQAAKAEKFKARRRGTSASQ
ncbi:hypothetical protein BG006_001122 [Podila minutissima]|uniref:sn-1-specific diacylglycerol lipase n=1 Tax=Podila minutissima TaxID=64525 RepID=A0A9P5SD59_9FUNG|nr:hypothetical protein BG006_001122 [Podila minutissima]